MVTKRSFSKLIVIHFLKLQNEWVVFKNNRFFSENETIVFENETKTVVPLRRFLMHLNGEQPF